MVSLIDMLSWHISFCQLSFRSLLWTKNYHFWDFDCRLLVCVCVTGVAGILRRCIRTVQSKAVMKVPILRSVCLNVCSCATRHVFHVETRSATAATVLLWWMIFDEPKDPILFFRKCRKFVTSRWLGSSWIQLKSHY